MRRCLVLRDHLSRAGWATRFACISETPEVVPAIEQGKIFEVVSGAGEQVATSLREMWPRGADLLVVDNYELDTAFEAACRPWARRILVIDDLADRVHDCDLLLDANYGRLPADYREFVPANSRLLIGPRYCLLRPEFRRQRRHSLFKRSRIRAVERIFVSMGGVDSMNATSFVLKALVRTGFQGHVDVAVGSASPHLASVKRLLPKLPYAVRLHIDCDRLAAVMADCDLGIGAGGTMSWERFCLGLPSLILPIAENQLPAAMALAKDGQALVASPFWQLQEREFAALVRTALSAHKLRGRLQARNASCVDGDGVQRVVKELMRCVQRSGARAASSTAGVQGCVQ